MKKMMILAVALIATLALVAVPVGAYIVTQDDLEGAPGAEFFERGYWGMTEGQENTLPADIYLNIGDSRENVPYLTSESKNLQITTRMNQFYYNWLSKGEFSPMLYYVPLPEGNTIIMKDDNLIPEGMTGINVVPIT